MNIAFYAPMKSPDSANPSGDRLIGRLLIKALEECDCAIGVASHFRSYDRTGDVHRQKRIASIGEKVADRIVARLLKAPEQDRPDLWFTYHLFYKAPDRIGPRVARQLSIPYVVAEASYAPKQEDGPWSVGHTSVRNTPSIADLVIGLNSQDKPCVAPLLSSPDRYQQIAPFLDSTEFNNAGNNRHAARREVSSDYSLNTEPTWLLTVAMMRSGDKVGSYEILAMSLEQMTERNWILLVVGSDPEEPKVRAMFSKLSGQVVWLGKLSPEQLPRIYAAADLFVWPAVKESPGMCFLEAQAAGTPVIGSSYGGIPDIVVDRNTGLLAKHLDVTDFANCVQSLIRNPERRKSMGIAARNNVHRVHRIETASARLNQLLSTLLVCPHSL